MPNGKPHDNPVTDTVEHGLHPFPEYIETLVLELHTLEPYVFNDLGWAPFHWEKQMFLPEAESLLKGLIQTHGDPIARRKVIEQYQLATAAEAVTRRRVATTPARVVVSVVAIGLLIVASIALFDNHRLLGFSVGAAAVAVFAVSLTKGTARP